MQTEGYAWTNISRAYTSVSVRHSLDRQDFLPWRCDVSMTTCNTWTMTLWKLERLRIRQRHSRRQRKDLYTKAPKLTAFSNVTNMMVTHRFTFICLSWAK